MSPCRTLRSRGTRGARHRVRHSPFLEVEAVIVALQLLFGIAAVAVASYVFWRIGRPDGVPSRWRSLPGMEVLVVTIVLGGWAGGGSLIVVAITSIFTG
jgi:hypothetical protein